MDIRSTVVEFVSLGCFPYSKACLTKEKHAKVNKTIEYIGLKNEFHSYMDE